MEIQYAFDPDSTFQKKLNELYDKTGDLRIPLGVMATEWYRGNSSIFALKGPGRYQDLSERYKKRKVRPKNKGGAGFVYPILKFTGRLAGSITNPNHPEKINYIVNKSTLVLGTKVPYAIYHQSNKKRGEGPTGRSMPYRPFLFVGVEQIAPNDIQNKRLKNWLIILDNHLNEKRLQNGKL